MLIAVLGVMALGASLRCPAPAVPLDLHTPGPAACVDASRPADPVDASVVGTIDRYEDADRTLVLATKREPITFVLATDAVIRMGSRRLPASALASHRGRRAKVRYTDEDERLVAHWVVISADGPQHRGTAPEQ
ncbi:MAG TPA: hypothetical protein VFK20_06605 [Vicinamibacterales bacterium]|nr:hypothetical protein [Vicinamibacterales bacterium]